MYNRLSRNKTCNFPKADLPARPVSVTIRVYSRDGRDCRGTASGMERDQHPLLRDLAGLMNFMTGRRDGPDDCPASFAEHVAADERRYGRSCRHAMVAYASLASSASAPKGRPAAREYSRLGIDQSSIEIQQYCVVRCRVNNILSHPSFRQPSRYFFMRSISRLAASSPLAAFSHIDCAISSCSLTPSTDMVKVPTPTRTFGCSPSRKGLTATSER